MERDRDTYSEKETIERREVALKRMLATPHKPHSESKVGKRTKRRRASPRRNQSVEKGNPK
jgi:hypothetical protein